MRNETNKPQLSQLVGTYFIKLANLSALIQQAYAGSDAADINFFIDIYSIKKTILKSDFATSGDNELCSLIMDMIVFYKNYFRGIGVHVNFYIIDSNNIPASNRQVFPSYNSDFVIALTSKNTEYIEYNMDLVKILCGYLPDITYIRTKFESSVIMADVIGLCCGTYGTNTKPSIVLSKDPYCMMLVNYDGTGNTTWIRPKKYKGMDSSYICTSNNLHQIVEYELGVTNMDPRLRTGIGGMLSTIFACTKFPARCIPPIMQYRTFMSMLCEIRNKRCITLSDVFAAAVTKTKCSYEDFDKRYTVLDIPTQHHLYRSSTEFAVNSNPAPKMTDIEGLKHINNNYFSSNPLMLDDLLR